jgi:heavy metal sensor kinase
MLFGRLKDVLLTLRFRLIAWVTLVVFLVVAVAMLSVRAVVLRALNAEFDQVLLQDMTDVRQHIVWKYFTDEDRFKETINRRSFGHIHVDWFVQLYDVQGNLKWASANAPNLPPPRPNVDAAALEEVKPKTEGAVRVVTSTFQEAGYPPLIIRLGSTRRSIDDDIDLLNWIMILGSASILVLAPLCGYFLAGRATRPLNKIITTTARLQPKNLDERLPILGSGDELDQLSATINGMLDRIAVYIDSNRDFIANAAHELRSPLAAIRSSVDVALDRLRTPDEYSALLTDVAEECSRLTHLLNRLLLLAEGDAGRLGPKNQDGPSKNAQLDKVVRESFNMFEAVAESKGVELKLADLAPAIVPGEEYHLRQVVRNLIDNAIKFTPSPGRILVDLALDPDKKLTTLRVSDSGVGIAPEELPRIFERFYRCDKSRAREQGPGGNGLGLAICQAIVSALQGTINVQSKPGQGSTFTVTLPLA